MKTITQNSTNQIWTLVADDSSSATGGGLTGLLYNSAGLTAKWKAEGDASWTTITLQDITTLGTYESGGGGFKEATSGAGGEYEFQPLDNMFTALGKKYLVIYGATNLAPIRLEFEVINEVATEANVNDLKGPGFDSSTDSNEAIRDRGDVAWATGVLKGSTQ